MTKYIDAERLRAEIKFAKSVYDDPKRVVYGVADAYRQDGRAAMCDDILKKIDSLQQEQSKERLIQVKCISPYDESWEKDKVYTCNVWHHGSLNIDFWDVYYDYGNKPNYVQFSSIEMLNKEFAILQQEQPEVDLEKFTDKIKTFQGRYKYPEIVSIKGAMAFMARMFYQYPNVARQWYDNLPKVTMD